MLRPIHPLMDAGKDFARTVRETLTRLEDGVARLARIYCDLRTYDDDQVRRVHDWFIREAARSAPIR